MKKIKSTMDKINDGTIRIENGRLIGLGITESISVESIDNLMWLFGKATTVETLSTTIAGVGRAVSYLAMNHPDILDGHIDCMLPDESYLYNLNEILKFFNE